MSTSTRATGSTSAGSHAAACACAWPRPWPWRRRRRRAGRAASRAGPDPVRSCVRRSWPALNQRATDSPRPALSNDRVSTPVIGIVSPGAMGAALGRSWEAGGARVVTTVEGRSDRTRGLASGLSLLPTLADVVATSTVVVSICPPGEAEACLESILGAAAEDRCHSPARRPQRDLARPRPHAGGAGCGGRPRPRGRCDQRRSARRRAATRPSTSPARGPTRSPCWRRTACAGAWSATSRGRRPR